MYPNPGGRIQVKTTKIPPFQLMPVAKEEQTDDFVTFCASKGQKIMFFIEYFPCNVRKEIFRFFFFFLHIQSLRIFKTCIKKKSLTILSAGTLRTIVSSF